MDDIDDILDDAELKFCSKPVYNVGSKSYSKKDSVPKKDNSLNDMMNEIFDDGDYKETDIRNTSSKTNTIASNTDHLLNKASPTKKCQYIYLNNTKETEGVSTAINKRSCDRLRCTECDFVVVSFEGYAWKQNIDYLFLRNNSPDFKKLKPKLVKNNGHRSYCCQCKSITVTESMQKCTADFKWTCMKH